MHAHWWVSVYSGCVLVKILRATNSWSDIQTKTSNPLKNQARQFDSGIRLASAGRSMRNRQNFTRFQYNDPDVSAREVWFDWAKQHSWNSLKRIGTWFLVKSLVFLAVPWSSFWSSVEVPLSWPKNVAVAENYHTGLPSNTQCRCIRDEESNHK